MNFLVIVSSLFSLLPPDVLPISSLNSISTLISPHLNKERRKRIIRIQNKEIEIKRKSVVNLAVLIWYCQQSLAMALKNLMGILF